MAWLLLIPALLLLILIVYWQLVIAEGVYLGPRIVRLLYDWTAHRYDRIKEFEESGDIDFAHEVPTLARYRVNFFRQLHGIGAVFREIPNKIMTIDELGLPLVMKRMALLPKGPHRKRAAFQ